MHFKTFFRIFRKLGSRSSVAFYARADMQNKGAPLERDFRCSSELQATVKILDAQKSRSTGARSTLERETQVLARADCKHMQSTGYTYFTLERHFPRLSRLYEHKAYARAWSSSLKRESKI